MFSFVGDTVLDPFLGTGTTSVVAMGLYRSSIGFEVDPHYYQTAKGRLVGLGLYSDLYRCTMEFRVREPG